MKRWIAYFLRVVSIIVGFVAGNLAAAAFIMLLIAGGLDWTGENGRLVHAGLVISILALAALFGSLSFVPAMIMVGIAEVMERRSWLFHALAGGAAAGAVYFFRPDRETVQVPDPGLFAAGLAAGFVGGTVYWLIAGRTSGQVMTDVASGRYDHHDA